jgi:light-harvesting complex I chlorophyll a/b binding protein 5
MTLLQGIVESESATQRFKEKEIKHGRLAMVAMVGLFAQAACTHDGPFLNLLNHIEDPLGSNVLTELEHINE